MYRESKIFEIHTVLNAHRKKWQINKQTLVFIV